MEFIGTDTNFRPQAQLVTVVEAGAGVHHHRRRIDRRREPLRRRQVARDNGVGMVRAVALDVGDCLVERGHHLDRQNQVEILRRPVVFRGRRDVGDDPAGYFAAAQFYAALAEDAGDSRQKFAGDLIVDQEALRRVAHARPLTLGVDDDALGHRQVGGGVHVDVAVALVVLEHRHGRLGGDAADQPLAAARDYQVDVLVQPQQLADGVAVRRRHQLHGVGGQVIGPQGVLQDAVQGRVGLERFLAAAEHQGVAAFDAQAGGIDGDVGARFVDEEDDAQRHGDLVDLQAVGPHAAVEDAADRIGQRGDLAQPRGCGADALRRQTQAVLLRGGQFGGGGRGQVAGVGFEDFRGPRLQLRSGLEQPAVLALAGRGGHEARSGARPLGEVQTVGVQIRHAKVQWDRW